MNPNVNYRPWVTMVCQCRNAGSTVTNLPFCCGMLIVKEMVYIGVGRYRGTLFFPLTFTVNLKLVKIKVYFRKKKFSQNLLWKGLLCSTSHLIQFWIYKYMYYDFLINPCIILKCDVSFKWRSFLYFWWFLIWFLYMEHTFCKSSIIWKPNIWSNMKIFCVSLACM